MTEIEFAPIYVNEHAVDRARERLGWGGDDVRTRIRSDVRLGMIADRVTETQPNWTRGPGAESIQTRGQRFVWNPDASYCWVIVVRAEGVYVRTVLPNVAERSARAADHRIWKGMKRR